MSIENGNTQSERPIKILAARIEGMTDEHGRQFGNDPRLTLLVEGQREADWRFEQIGDCFVAEVDGFFHVFFHDGSEKNAGGFGGRKYELDMIDGSTRTIRGPWAGNPRDFYRDVTKKFGRLIDVHFAESEIDYAKRSAFFGLWISLDRALEACAIAEPVVENCPMIKAVPVITERGSVSFALVKMGLRSSRLPTLYEAGELEESRRELARSTDLLMDAIDAAAGEQIEVVAVMSSPRDRNLIEGET